MEYYNKITENYINALKHCLIFPKFKVELMDYNENVILEITQDISNSDSGSISINYQQGVRRSCSITLINLPESLYSYVGKYTPSERGLIWMNTKFKLYTGIGVPISSEEKREIFYDESDYVSYKNEVNDPINYRADSTIIEQDIYWFSQGVYIVTNPNALRDMSKGTVTLNGVDKFGLFGSETNFNQTEAIYKINYNSSVGNIIKSILKFNRGNGSPIDPIEPYIDSNVMNLKVPYDIEKPASTYFSDILIELANIFACDIFYDVNGRLNFVKGNEHRGMEDYASIWDYSDEESEYFSPQMTYNFTETYNIVKVIGDNKAAPEIYEYTAKNDEPNSPTRISLIGEKIKYIESTFCYNLDRTKDFARYMLQKLSRVPLTLSFQSSMIPHLEVNNVITITDKFFNYNQERFVIQSLTMPLSTKSLIDIEATNTANIPYFEY